MFIKMLGVYGGVFVGMLALALFATGTFQQGILPRLSGHRGEGAGEPSEAAHGSATEGGPKVPVAASEPQQPAAPSTPAPSATAAISPAPSATGPEPAAAGGRGLATVPQREVAPGIEAGRDAQVKRLARMYEGMRPKEAAAVLEKIERPLATQVLQEVKERQAAKILAAMNPSVAAELTRLLGPKEEKATP